MNLRKLAAMLLSFTLATGAIGQAVFAKETTVTPSNTKVTSGTMNSTQNTVPITSTKIPSSPDLGGGPSPDATWTKVSSWYQNFSRSQLSQLNQQYNAVVTNPSYSQGQQLYSAANLLTGFLDTTISLTISGATTFCQSYFTLVQNSANTVNQAYYECSATGTEALYVTEYRRDATGEIIYSLSWY